MNCIFGKFKLSSINEICGRCLRRIKNVIVDFSGASSTLFSEIHLFGYFTVLFISSESFQVFVYSVNKEIIFILYDYHIG